MSMPSSPESRRGPGGEIAWVAARTGAAVVAGAVDYFVRADGALDGIDRTAVVVALAVALGVWVGLEILRRVFYRRSTG